MKLTFLGTRGAIDATSSRHRRHASLLVEYHRRRVMVDCGADWRGRIGEVRPHAIVVTHAHPDHAAGLDDGAPCPVHAPREAWRDMADYPVEERRVIPLEEEVEIGGVAFTAFPVEHSLNAPAVAYRITAGAVTIAYAPDVVYIHDRSGAMRGAKLYVGDGAALTRSLVRARDDALIGHTPVRTQLTWCAKEGVPRMIVTHCGTEIVEGDERTLGAELRSMAEERSVEAEIAHDGMELVLR